MTGDVNEELVAAWWRLKHAEWAGEPTEDHILEIDKLLDEKGSAIPEGVVG